MAKKSKKNKNNTMSMAANGLVMLMALLVIISMFMAYMKVDLGVFGKSSASGWKIFDSDGNSDVKAYIVLSVIFAAVAAGIGLFRLINFPIFRSKLFGFIFIGVTAAMVLFAILIMVGIKDGTGGSLVKLGVGAILNLIFSIFAVAGAVVGFLTDK